MHSRRAARIVVIAVLGSVGCHSRQNGGAAVLPTRHRRAVHRRPSPIPAYESDGSGAIVGAELTATLCHVGVFAYVSPDTTPPGRTLLNLDGHSPKEFLRLFQRTARVTT